MLLPNQIEKINAEIEKVATLHLNAIDIDTALNNYSDEMVAISNTAVFISREELSVELNHFYNTLKSVNHASWEDIHIHIINESSATFTAKFNYGFTSNDGEYTDLIGVWTALFILDEGIWKIRLRHESFREI